MDARGVTELTNRSDTAKITMQTRVAVRDKDPHRFQVVPLREAAKQHASPSPRAGISSTPAPPQAHTSKIYVHRDEPEAKEAKPLARSKRTARREPVLQAKDVNINVPKGKHRKAQSLEADRLQQTNAPTHSSLLEPPTEPQYSFSLKPFKVLPAGSGSGVAQTARGERSQQRTNAIVSDLSGDIAAPEPATMISNDLTSVSSPASSTCDIGHEATREQQDTLFARNETPVGLRYAHSGPYSFRPTAGDSQKRHAIYASADIMPDVDFLGEFRSPSTAQSAKPLDPTSEEANEHGNQPPEVAPLKPASLHSAAFESATAPLNVAPRPLVPPLHFLDSGYLFYPPIVSDLLDELDRDILSWNFLSS